MSKSKRKLPGYWKSKENVLAEVRKVMDEHGFDSLPTQNKLAELGYSSLAFAIHKYHGGFHKFRKILGEEQKIRERNVWQDLEYTFDQARQVMDKHGFDSLPGGYRLEKLGYSSLSTAIQKYHGGYRKFRELLGEEQRKREDGLWQDLEYTFDQARQVMDKHGFDTLPNQNKLSELGYSGLSNAISRHHGGFRKFRKLLGEEQRKVEDGLWQNLDYTLTEARKVMDEHGFDSLPGGNKLSELGYSALATAIHRYHGGFPYFRKLLNQELGIPSEREKLEKVLSGYVEE